MYPSWLKRAFSHALLLSTAVSLLFLNGLSAKASTFVFATFKGDTDPGEKLSIYTSTDGLNFSLLSDTGFEGTSSTLRDPSIMKHTDGKYYVAYTNPPTASCCGKEDHFSIASSTDLIHWTNVATVAAGVSGVAHTWAPEWFIDGSTVKIIANIDTLNNDTDFKPYVFTAQNASLTSWTGPVAIGVGPNYIDAFAMKVGSVYHLFVKNEKTRYVEHATAPSLTGPWTFVGTANWAGWGSGREGPCVVKLDNGLWRIFLDGQGSVGFLYSDSVDLNTWSAPFPLPAVTNIVRHGTIISIGSASIANGTYKIINRKSGLALDVAGGGITNGANVDQATYTGGNNQRWNVTSLGSNQYSIIGVGSGKSLDVTAHSTADGANIEIYTYSGGNNQRWTFTPTTTGYYTITSVNSGKVVDVVSGSTASGANVDQWTSTGGTNQQWILQAP
jgi:hypothetical protein